MKLLISGGEGGWVLDGAKALFETLLCMRVQNLLCFPRKINSLLKILNDFPSIYSHKISVAVIGDADIWPNQKKNNFAKTLGKLL